MIRVLIAEDSPHIRDSLSELLAEEPDMDLVGAAGDGLEAVEKGISVVAIRQLGPRSSFCPAGAW